MTVHFRKYLSSDDCLFRCPTDRIFLSFTLKQNSQIAQQNSTIRNKSLNLLLSSYCNQLQIKTECLKLLMVYFVIYFHTFLEKSNDFV